MRVGLVVDSACDLPSDYIRSHGMFVLPISVRVNDELFVDSRDPQATLNFLTRDLLHRDSGAEAVPYPAEDIARVFLEEVVPQYDYAICLTITRARSRIFDNVIGAERIIRLESKAVREQLGEPGLFVMRVINTETLFTGQGVLAAHAIRLIRQQVEFDELYQRIEAMTANIFTYCVAPDTYYLREQAREHGDRSLSWATSLMARTLNVVPVICVHADAACLVARARSFDRGVQRVFAHAVSRLHEGLLEPTICISYAGNPIAVETMPGFAELSRVAREYGVEVLVTMMSLAGAVNTGPGTLTLGLASPSHEFSG
ncbi:MAG: DegV family protein [Aquisalimonadaceae bacterium]